MKRILSIVLTLALLLTALPLALGVSAAEPTVAATFEFGENDTSKAGSESSSAKTTYTEENNGYTLNLTDCDKMYPGAYDAAGNSCLKLGSSKAAGKFTFIVPDDIIKVVIMVAGRQGSTTSVTVNGTTTKINTISNNAEYTPVEVDTSTTKTVTLTTVKNGDIRAMVNSIVFYTSGEGGGSTEPECEHTGETTYGKTDSEHWLICDDCSKEIANSREKHNFSNGDCVCGQEAPESHYDLTKDYYMTATDSENNVYYFSGITSGGGDIATDASEAMVFNLEFDGINYYIYTMDGQTKSYLVSGDGTQKYSFSSTPCAFAYSSLRDTLYEKTYSRAPAVYVKDGNAVNIRAYAVGTDNNFTNNLVVRFVVVPETAECTHENTTTTNTATYFKDGMVTVVCDDCGETVSETEANATDVALSSCEEKFENGKLTITLTYTKALLEDIDNGAEIYFNYSIDGFNNSVKIVDKESESLDTETVITLEGFNASRLNSKLTYNLSAVYAGVNTDKLAEEAKGEIEIAKKLDDKTSTFINTLNTAENTVVSGKAASTDEFATNTITADLKAGEMYLNFIASSDLVKKLTENNAYARENKVVVTVDGLSAVELDLPVLRQSTTLKISGMSFEQLYGTVTIKLVFNYPDNTGLNFETAEVVFDGSAAVAATNSRVAAAFAAYMTK